MEANTDVIVKEAGISKGLIFHYFGSKRGIFLFLMKYALDIFTTEYEKVISESNDFLENIRIISKMKGELSRQYPLLFGFMVKAQSSIKEVFSEGLPGDLMNLTYMGMKQICQK
jgi:AcrR family transcriptional regulator